MWCWNSLFLSFVVLAVSSNQGVRGQEGARQPAVEAPARAATAPTDPRRWIDLQILVKEQERALLEKELAELQPQIAEIREWLARIGRSSPDLKSLEMNIETMQEFIKHMNPQVEAIRIELGAPPPVQLVQQSTASTTINELQRYGGAVAAGVAGFVLLAAVGLLFPRRRRAAVTVVALFFGAIFAGAAWWFWPASSHVEALLRVTPAADAMDSVVPGAPSSPAFDTARRTQAGLLKSDLILVEALRDPKVSQLPIVANREDKVAWLQRELSVELPEDTELIRLRLAAEDPLQSLKIMDAVVESYFSEHVDRERQIERNKLQRLEDALQQKQEQLRQLNSRYLGLRAQLGGHENPQAMAQVITQDLRDLQTTRRELNQKLREISAELSRLRITREAAADPRRLLEPFKTPRAEPDVRLFAAIFTALNELRDEVAALRSEIQTLRKETAQQTETEPAREKEE